MALTIAKIESEKMVGIISSITADRPWVLVEENDEQRIWREQGCVHLMDYDVDIYQAVSECYAIKNGIGESDLLFPVSVRTVQHHLKQATDYLHITGVSSHSMRKFLATSLYSQTKDPELVRSVLLHSSIQVTQNYLSIEPEAVGQALQNHFVLPFNNPPNL